MSHGLIQGRTLAGLGAVGRDPHTSPGRKASAPGTQRLWDLPEILSPSCHCYNLSAQGPAYDISRAQGCAQLSPLSSELAPPHPPLPLQMEKRAGVHDALVQGWSNGGTSRVGGRYWNAAQRELGDGRMSHLKCLRTKENPGMW